MDREGLCMPIYLNEGDNRFRHSCMEFMRSVPAQNPYGTQILPREQVNVLTSFIDGSPIYGSSDEVQREVRCHSRGMWDLRVNEQPGLTVLHTVLNKMHNRIAAKLRQRLGRVDEEILFQETRKVVIAIIQNIQYAEWLPLTIGNQIMKKYGLHTGKRVTYSGRVDPRVFNAFSTAAFRFGHSLIPEHYNISGKLVPLRKLFNNPSFVFRDFKGVLNAMLKAGAESQLIDGHIVSEVTHHLFEPKEQVDSASSLGLDLVAFNIQRGRDHGLPPYNKYRVHCGLPPVTDFYNISSNPEVGQQLQSLYDSVEDIDLFTGGLLEDSVENGRVGATFACIMAVQFHALKYGDRFYFETYRHPEGFTDG
ncbi:hypothetical protein ACOMHN_066816 [Nucella lapillus]